jgi:Fic family protein
MSPAGCVTRDPTFSTVIREQKNKYYKAIKDVEDYDSDLTYFIEFNVKLILISISNILKKVFKEIQSIL